MAMRFVYSNCVSRSSRSFQLLVITVFWMIMAISCPTTQAKDILIGADRFIVPKDKKGPLPPETARVGDTIIFEWNGVHNVNIHPFRSCSILFRKWLGDQSGASYTFTKEDENKDILFSCDIGNHCAKGMRMTVTVLPCDDDDCLDDASDSTTKTTSISSWAVLSATMVLMQLW